MNSGSCGVLQMTMLNVCLIAFCRFKFAARKFPRLSPKHVTLLLLLTSTSHAILPRRKSF